MKFRTTLIMLAVLAALASYVFLVEMRKPTAEQGAGDFDVSAWPTPLSPLWNVYEEQVRALRVERAADGQRVELLRGQDDLWQLVSPRQEEADQWRVSTILYTLANPRPQRMLGEDAGQPSDYGLAPPAITAELELQDDSVRRLFLGAQNPAGSAYYGQAEGDAAIYLFAFYTGSELERLLDEPPYAPTPTPSAAPPGA